MSPRATLGAVAAFTVLAAPGDALAGGSTGFGDSVVVFGGPGRIVHQTEMPVEIRGRVEVDFHGNARSGCAFLGTCDTAGRIVWEPGRHATLAILDVELNRRRFVEGVLSSGIATEDGSSVVAMTRRGSGEAATACADARHPLSGMSLDPAARGGLRVSLAGSSGEDLLATRCGGPLAADISSALPRPVLSSAVVRRGRTTLSLPGESGFAAHGFAGTVRSSVTLRLGRPRTASGNTDPPASLPRRRVRVLTASYRIEQLTGRVRIGFRGDSQLARCEPLDACGLTGTVDLVTRATRGDAVLIATGPASIPRDRFRAALGLAGGSARGVTVVGGGDWRETGRAVQTQKWRGGGFCRSSTPAPGGAFLIRVGGRRASVDFLGVSGDGGPQRGRCPGPLASEVGALVSGSVALRSFGPSRVVLRLRRGHAFSGEAHAGATSGVVTIVLRRLSVRESSYLELAAN